MPTIISFQLILLMLGIATVNAFAEAAQSIRYTLGNRIPMTIAIERYMMRDSWTPLLVTVSDLQMTLWMDKSGSVYERSGREGSRSMPLFSIDIFSGRINTGNGSIPFRWTEDDEFRARMLVSDGPDRITLIQSEDGRSAEIRLFDKSAPPIRVTVVRETGPDKHARIMLLGRYVIQRNGWVLSKDGLELSDEMYSMEHNPRVSVFVSRGEQQ